MQGMNIELFLSIVIPLSLYFLITLAGAFVKDMYNSIRGIDNKFRLYRMITGALVSAFLMVGLENWLLKHVGLKEIVVLSFFIGIISFELFEKISKIDSIIKYYKIIQDIKNGRDVQLPDDTKVTVKREEPKNKDDS
jgi:hypothetical protein